MTEIFRFHLNFLSANLTRGSMINAVRSAKMIGRETGIIKMKLKIVIMMLSVIIKLRFVSHFVNGHSPRLFATSIITKRLRIEYY